MSNISYCTLTNKKEVYQLCCCDIEILLLCVWMHQLMPSSVAFPHGPIASPSCVTNCNISCTVAKNKASTHKPTNPASNHALELWILSNAQHRGEGPKCCWSWDACFWRGKLGSSSSSSIMQIKRWKKYISKQQSQQKWINAISERLPLIFTFN